MIKTDEISLCPDFETGDKVKRIITWIDLSEWDEDKEGIWNYQCFIDYLTQCSIDLAKCNKKILLKIFDIYIRSDEREFQELTNDPLMVKLLMYWNENIFNKIVEWYSINSIEWLMSLFQVIEIMERSTTQILLMYINVCSTISEFKEMCQKTETKNILFWWDIYMFENICTKYSLSSLDDFIRLNKLAKLIRYWEKKIITKCIDFCDTFDELETLDDKSKTYNLLGWWKPILFDAICEKYTLGSFLWIIAMGEIYSIIRNWNEWVVLKCLNFFEKWEDFLDFCNIYSIQYIITYSNSANVLNVCSQFQINSKEDFTDLSERKNILGFIQ